MKRIALIILAVTAIIAGSISCRKINDIDKRLTELEQTVSDLKAQIAAGAVITSVEKTEDGCTFILSNGQSYTVTNGTDGTDGEAIIADIKIEDDFVVLTLKNDEILRISYLNPLSMVTVNIVPDYDDGTVKAPETVETPENKSTSFYLDIAVTPAKYAEILSDTERFIHKAVFSPVLTKSDFGNAFTLSPTVVTYAEGASIPFLQASFDLDDETAAALKNSAYTVSYSIEVKSGIHGVATAYVAIADGKDSDPVIPEGALPGVFSVSSTQKVYFSKGNLWSDAKEFIPTLRFEENQWCTTPFTADSEHNVQRDPEHVSHFFWTDSVTNADDYICPYVKRNFFASEANPLTINDVPGWYALSYNEWNYLINYRTINGGKGFQYTCIWKEIEVCEEEESYFVKGLVIFPDDYPSSLGTDATWDQMETAGCVFLPAAGQRFTAILNADNYVEKVNSYGHYWTSTPYSMILRNDCAYCVRFYGSNCLLNNDASRVAFAKSVRLVKKCEE